MAYRSSHYRRGYYRRTRSGSYSWVSPTYVSGYEYTPGSPTFLGRLPNIVYSDNHIPLPEMNIHSDRTTLEKICDLFRTLDSGDRKYCLDLLESIDIQMDEEITNTNANAPNDADNDFGAESDPNLFLTEPYEQGLCITRFIGFDEKEIRIPSSINGKPVLALDMEAFKQVNSLTAIYIPDTIVSIGTECFCLCSNLQKVRLSNNLRVLGDNAFSSTKIEEIELPDSVISISTECFRESALRTIKLSSSLTQIGAYSFFKCPYLKTISIPNKVRTISKYAFYGCSALQKVTLTNTLETIEESAFKDCTSLLSIDIPPSVTNIGTSAFSSGDYLWLDIIIKCQPGSTAQQHARERNIKAVASQIVYSKEMQDVPSVYRIGYDRDRLPMIQNTYISIKTIFDILGYRPKDLLKIDSISYCFTIPSKIDDARLEQLKKKTHQYNFDLQFTII